MFLFQITRPISSKKTLGATRFSSTELAVAPLRYKTTETSSNLALFESVRLLHKRDGLKYQSIDDGGSQRYFLFKIIKMARY